MSDVETVKQKVEAFLTSQGRVGLDSDGDYSLGAGSTRVFVRVGAHPNGKATTVFVMAPVLIGAPATPELYEYVATTDTYIFGRLVAIKSQTGDVNVFFSHMLLGDYLDREELLYAVGGVASSADDMDEELQAKFGGKRFSET